MNRVSIARRGLILGEDEAAAPRKLFKHPPGPPGPVLTRVVVLFCFCLSFEGVCLTPVILATVRGEGRLRAAGRYVVLPESGGSAGSADEFQIVQIMCFLQQK